MQGWIKLHRKLLENAVMSKGAYLQIWLALLLLANHKETEFIFNNRKQVLQPGQLITGRKKLKEITGIPESTIEDILRYLENEKQIRQQKTSKFRIISVCNWHIYQNEEELRHQTDNTSTSSRHLTNTYKNDKNEKNFYRKKDFYQSKRKEETCHEMMARMIKEGTWEQ
jgi:endonuclease III-like uncharacterized protein